jgi:hypothetical protein
MIARRRTELLTLLFLLLLVAGLATLFWGQNLDRGYVTYRVARRLAAGQRLTYNPAGEGLPAAVSPLYAGLLALGAALTPDIPTLSNLIGVVSIALGAAALYLLTYPAGKLTAAGAAALYVTFPLLWLSLGLEAPLWMALALWAAWMHARSWGVGAAVLLALATLIRPESLTLAAALVLDSVATGRRFNALAPGVYAVTLVGGLLWIAAVSPEGAAFGLPGLGGGLPLADTFAPHAAAGLLALAAGVLALSPFWAALLILSVPGVLRLRPSTESDAHRLWLVPGWAAIHLLALIALGAPVYAWHYAPLAAALALLAPLGIQWIARRFEGIGVRRAIIATGGLLLAAAAVDAAVRLSLSPGVAGIVAPPRADAAYAEAAGWVRANTSPDARIGSDRIGLLGYVVDHPIIDAGGTLQADIAAAQARGDRSWWVSAYTPDVLVLSADALDAPTPVIPLDDPWFGAAYTEAARAGSAGEVVILTRTGPPATLTEHLAGMVTFPNGVVLNSIATDFGLEPLESGRLGRIRLEWMLEQPVDGVRQIAIRIQSRGGAIAALNTSTVDFSGWPTRRLVTTYHSVDLVPSPQPGVYDVFVGIGPDADHLAWQATATGKIPFPETVYVGALSGASADFGAISLEGYRLSRSDEGLEVVLVWQAQETPHADYVMFVHVRDARGTVVLRHESQPYQGAYPTSVWSIGEQVPESTVLDVSGLPPGEYEVYAGLIDPDGTRLLTLDGRDAVFVGRTGVE